jgi:hypothetical protein
MGARAPKRHSGRAVQPDRGRYGGIEHPIAATEFDGSVGWVQWA